MLETDIRVVTDGTPDQRLAAIRRLIRDPSVMRRWDTWRSVIAKGDHSSWARDGFEALLDCIDELCGPYGGVPPKNDAYLESLRDYVLDSPVLRELRHKLKTECEKKSGLMLTAAVISDAEDGE